MKSYELIIIAAPETDLVRVRTNIRREEKRQPKWAKPLRVN